MKSYLIFLIAWIVTIFLFSVSNLSAEIKLYDDYSTGYLDGNKWKQREYVREIINGQFVSKLGNRSPGMGAEIAPGIFRNNLPFTNPETIDSIECEITIVETILDNALDSKSYARIGGYFYNKNATGGATGDIYAQLMIGDQGNGKIEAFWEVQETLTDDTSTWSIIGSGTISGFDTSTIAPPYKVKLSYDGNNTFNFAINDIYTDNYIGPIKNRNAVTFLKDLSTAIDATNGSNTGLVVAEFDNVYINDENSIYDDFSSLLIDLTKWKYNEWIREASNGYLRANIIGNESTRTANTYLTEKDVSYLEAKVRIESGSQLSTGANGIGRIQGYYYNDSRGPGSGQDYNRYEGDVFVQVRLIYKSDGTLSADAYVHLSDDENESSFTELFAHNFSVPIYLDTFYSLSIRFEGGKFVFSCDGENTEYNITTSIYPAYGEHRLLRSRVNLDSGETGYIKVCFDDVYIEESIDACLFDFSPADGDVDGSDLVAYISDQTNISLEDFAEEFGRTNCP